MLRTGGVVGMNDMAFIVNVSRTLENKIAIAENNNQNTLLVTLDVLKNILTILKEQEERKDWISVKDDMPVELHSIFWSFLGTDKWSNAMWREQSDKVLVAVEFADGTRLVTTGKTHDGKWRTSISPTIPHLVTHWMKMPDLPQI